MPMMGFGTWQLRGNTAREALGWAFGSGYRHLDTATLYGNEAEVGAAVRDSGLRRDEVFVTTKLPPERVGREDETLRQSLEALQSDYVDLWLVHWPPARGAGVGTWLEFVTARSEGRARSIGVSNYSLDQIDQLTEGSGVTPALNQVEWSPFLHDQAFVDGCRERGVVVEGYSPFRASRLDHEVLTEIAERHGKDAAQVVLRWHLQHGIVVIPKSARRERIASNADVLDFELTADEMSTLDGLSDAG